MRRIRAVIFDLDGVIVSTDEHHFQAWKQLADEEGIPFDRNDNERLRGVSRMESLEIILEKSTKRYSSDQKRGLAERKNAGYREVAKGLVARGHFTRGHQRDPSAESPAGENRHWLLEQECPSNFAGCGAGRPVRCRHRRKRYSPLETGSGRIHHCRQATRRFPGGVPGGGRCGRPVLRRAQLLV